MKKTLHKAWVHLFIAGISSLLFGSVTLAFPAFPFLSLVGLFASYIIIKGFAISIGAWQTRQEEKHWLYLIFYGALNILTGIVTLVFPILTLLILGFIVSVNLLICGVLQIMIAYHLRKEVKGIGWLIFSGIVAVTAGAYIYIIPRISATMILYLIAIAALLLGLFLTSLSLHAASWQKAMKKPGMQIH